MNRTTGAETEALETAGQAPGILSHIGKVTLGIWGFYFVAKLALYWLELIGFHTWANLAFAAFILIPVNHVLGNRAKQLATVLLAVALLYYDSWLPAIGRVLSQATLVSGFGIAYLVELAGRFISLPVVAILIVAGVLYWLASRWIRLDAVVIAVMLGMPIMVYFKSPDPHTVILHQQFTDDETDWYAESSQPASPHQTATANQPLTAGQNTPASAVQAAQSDQPDRQDKSGLFAQPAQTVQASEPAGEDASGGGIPDMDKVLEKFFTREAARSVSFPQPRPGDVPFDVIFVHVCSLSWDDLRVTGLDRHPLWHRFDILLTHFNSASTYSGPAAIRMQRATCGQPTHTDLYSPAPDQCYLMDSLKRSGFEPGLVLNHDGHFDDFLKLVQTRGRLNVPPLPLTGALVTQHAFDNTPIYEDLSVLTRWLELRQKSASPRMAMYYNTVSLHDGNHLAGTGAKLSSRENFKIRLAKFLDDLDRFMQDLEKSGRRAVVAMVPEHGAALRGDKMQIAGLREIPSPAITLVPVGIRVVGGDLRRNGDTLLIGKSTSYLAVSHIVARLLENPPYGKGSFAPSDYAIDLPVTPFVAQNEEVVMAGYKGRYYLRQDESGWVDYTDF